MRTSRLLGSFALFASSSLFAVLPACSGENKSGLMLAITTDMKAPKDVNAVAVTISTNNTIKHNVIGRVTPQGDILLPATLAVVQPDDPNATIRIRVMAFQERKARVLRDVRTSIPAGGRVALLRIPLNFVNDGSVTGEIGADVLPAANPGTVPPGTPGTGTGTGSGSGSGDGGAVSKDGGVVSSDGGPVANGGSSSGGGLGSISGGDTFDPTVFVPNCPNPEHTWIDGECHDSYVDPNSLPDFDEKLVGAGDQPGVCFDTKTCFAQTIPLQGGAVDGAGNNASRDAGASLGSGTDGTPTGVDAGADPNLPKPLRPQNVTFNSNACTVQLDATVDPAKLNIAIVTRDTGECIRPGECYVPIDQGEGGWTLDGSTVKLPNFVCKLVNGKNLRLAYSTGCATKHVENPVCAETVASNTQPPVTGGEDGGVGPINAQAQLVVPEEFATSIAIDSGSMYLAGATRISRLPLFSSPPQAAPIAGIPNGKLPWTFGTAPFGMVLTNGTNTVYAYGGDGQPTPITLPPGASAMSAAYVSVNGFGQYVIAAGPKGNLGGLYGAVSNAAEKLPLQYPFDSTRQNDEAIVVAPTAAGFVYGNSAVDVIGCTPQNGQLICGVTNNFASRGAAPPTAFAGRPGDPSVGYGLFGSQVFRSTFVGQQGQVDVITIAQDDVTPVQVDGQFYRHSIIANDFCAFYTSGSGVGMVPDLGDKTAPGRILYTPPAGAHVLGVQVAQKLNVGGPPPANGQQALYFTVFAPMAQGGGLYMMDLPPECGGPTQSTPPDGGAVTDGGGASGDAGTGGFDASLPDAGVACANVGQDCSAMPCCAGQGVCSDTAVGDGGFARQCK